MKGIWENPCKGWSPLAELKLIRNSNVYNIFAMRDLKDYSESLMV